MPIADALKKKVAVDRQRRLQGRVGRGPFATGSPVITPIATGTTVCATRRRRRPTARRVGQSVDLPRDGQEHRLHARQLRAVELGRAFTGHFLDANCTTPLTTTTASIDPGDAEDICVKVDVPAGASNGDANAATVKATSVGNPAVSGTATITTIAVAVDTLLVDEDTQRARSTRSRYYKAR